VVAYDTIKKSPNFTIHRITSNQISSQSGIKAKRRSNFWVDDHNLKNKSPTNYDFKGSGYDRGHLVPAGDFYSDQLLKNETFVLTNICPQNPSLNRGIWANLEGSIRKIISDSGSTAYVITGVIHTDTLTIGIGEVFVPNYLYKIVYFPLEQHLYAFMFINENITGFSQLSDYQVSVDDIEKITSEDFFDRLDDNIEEKLESQVIPYKY